MVQPIPKPGDFVMMLHGEGHPRFIWRTTEVTIKPLSQVDEAFAWDEDEGDRTREWWLGHTYVAWPLGCWPVEVSAN
jgi:uncharacterized protein YhfF